VKKNLNLYVWFLLFVAVMMMAAFVAGMAVPWSLRPYGMVSLTGRIAQLTPEVLQVEHAPGSPAATDLQPLALFWDVREKILRNYVKPIKDDKILTYGAVRGMLAALKDPYSRFMTPEEYKEFRSSTEGQIQGIGAILTQKEVEGAEHPQVPQDEEALRQLVEQIAKGKISVEDAVARLRAFAKGPGPGSVVVVSVIPEGPAAKKDLRAGDIITKVDGHPVTGMWLSDVVEMIKGPAGTTVTLTIQRKGVDKPIEMTITRARVDIPVVQYEMRKGKIGYIWLRTFNKQAYAKLQEAIETLKDQGMKGLIFDLSANSGGLLPMAISVAGAFVSNQPVVYIQERGKEPEPYEAQNSPLVPPDLPVVVIIDGGSASASEIVAGCLQDLGRATLVGYHSFGKSKVQTVVELDDGSALVLTTAVYLTPHKRDIGAEDANGVRGIKPDVQLEEPNMEQPPSPEKFHEYMIKQAQEVLEKKMMAAAPAAKTKEGG